MSNKPKDRRERLLLEAMDVFGPRILDGHLGALLIDSGTKMCINALYPSNPESVSDFYDLQMATANVMLVAHYMNAMFTPEKDRLDDVVLLSLDNLERWIKSKRMESE